MEARFFVEWFLFSPKSNNTRGLAIELLTMQKQNKHWSTSNSVNKYTKKKTQLSKEVFANNLILYPTKNIHFRSFLLDAEK